MKQEFYTPSGYQTVETSKTLTYVAIVENDGVWSPISFTTTDEWSDSYADWERRVSKKVEDGEYAIYRVFRYEDADMVFAQLNAAVARLADFNDDERDLVDYQLARVRTLTHKYDEALRRAEFNRKVEAENVTA